VVEVAAVAKRRRDDARRKFMVVAANGEGVVVVLFCCFSCEQLTTDVLFALLGARVVGTSENITSLPLFWRYVNTYLY
jgi:hypothetical protein